MYHLDQKTMSLKRLLFMLIWIPRRGLAKKRRVLLFLLINFVSL